MNRYLLLLAATFVGFAAAQVPPPDRFIGRPRVVILSDIGNEPDDQMSLVRLLVPVAVRAPAPPT
jgi:hypothetical protein